jgi:hypothetical protein
LCKTSTVPEFPKENVLKNPTKAIELDAKYKEDAKKDEDFKNLRNDEDFKKIVG